MSVTQEPIIHVDATPDDEYPLRILRAYRENCNVRWQVDGNIDSRVYDMMNKHCEQRAVILGRAIKVLEQHLLNNSFAEFRQNLLVSLKSQSVFAGYSHPCEKIIYDAIDQFGSLVFVWLDSIYSDTESYFLCEGIIRCLGRQPYNIVDASGVQLACRGLIHGDPGVRVAAVGAFESWGGPDAISALKAHKDSVGWIADYVKQVIIDLSKDSNYKMAEKFDADPDSQR